MTIVNNLLNIVTPESQSKQGTLYTYISCHVSIYWSITNVHLMVYQTAEF